MKDFIELTRKIERIASVNGGRAGDAGDVTAATAAYLNTLLFLVPMRRMGTRLNGNPSHSGTRATHRVAPTGCGYFVLNYQFSAGHYFPASFFIWFS